MKVAYYNSSQSCYNRQFLGLDHGQAAVGGSYCREQKQNDESCTLCASHHSEVRKVSFHASSEIGRGIHCDAWLSFVTRCTYTDAVSKSTFTRRTCEAIQPRPASITSQVSNFRPLLVRGKVCGNYSPKTLRLQDPGALNRLFRLQCLH